MCSSRSKPLASATFRKPSSRYGDLLSTLRSWRKQSAQSSTRADVRAHARARCPSPTASSIAQEEKRRGGALDDLSRPPGAVAENFGAAAPIRKQISDLWSQDRGLQNARSRLGGAALSVRGGATMYSPGREKRGEKAHPRTPRRRVCEPGLCFDKFRRFRRARRYSSRRRATDFESALGPRR